MGLPPLTFRINWTQQASNMNESGYAVDGCGRNNICIESTDVPDTSVDALYVIYGPNEAA